MKLKIRDIGYIIERKQKGESFHQIGLIYGCTGQAVATHLKRNGVRYAHAFKVRRLIAQVKAQVPAPNVHFTHTLERAVVVANQ